jgi:predicted amidohydrolase
LNLRVAAYQFATTEDPERNADQILSAMGKASKQMADILVLPECCLSGYLPEDDLDYRLIRQLLSTLQQKCRELRLGLVVGSAVREKDKLYNRAHLFSKAGRKIGIYDKVALTGWGDGGIFSPGERLDTFTFERIRVGMQICYDMRYPENWRILRTRGARVVFLLANASEGGAWKRPVLTGTAACRASENGIFVVAANDARPPQMMTSSIHDPDGRLLAAAKPDAEDMIIADLDLSPSRKWFGDTIWDERPVHAWKGTHWGS